MQVEVTDEEVGEHLMNWRWRFNGGLYWIKPADKRAKIKFVPKPEQWEILEAIYERGEVRIAILKARQLGFSTLIALIALDMAMFFAGYTIGIVDQTKNDAQKKLQKVMLAWKNLPDDIKASYTVVSENKSEFSIRCGDDSESTIYAGTNARGGTHQLLWISEWGPIQVEDATRSDKIADGALPSAEEGIVIVETTWRGGRTGRLYEEVVKPALSIREEHRTLLDWKVYFYAWYLDPKYVFDGDDSQITEDCLKYFYDLETEEELVLSKPQKLWYFKKCWPKGHARFEEYPSCINEIFDTPLDGAIYAQKIIEAKIANRIFEFSPDQEQLVHTTWDIGSPRNTVVLYWQKVGFSYRLLDCDCNLEMTTAERIAHMNAKGYNYGVHLLPHDGKAKKEDALSLASKLKAGGLQGQVRVIERETHRAEEKRIGLMLDIFDQIYFNKALLSDEGGLLTALSAYRYKKSSKDGRITSEILHDWANHFGNAFGYWGEALKKRLVPNSESYGPRPAAAETPTRASGGRRPRMPRQSTAQM